MLADRAVAAENDVDKAKPGVAEIQVSESGKLVGLLVDLSRRLKKIETATAAKKTYGLSQTAENRYTKTPFVPNVQAKPFVPNNQNVNRQGVFTNTTLNKIVVLMHHSRIHSKIMLFNRSIQLMHLSAIITKHSVTKHARAQNFASFH